MSATVVNSVLLHLLATLLVLLNLSNIKIAYLADFLPLFDLMVVFYFAVFRPYFFKNWFLLFLGIIVDSFHGLPLGLSSLCYILAVRIFQRINHRSEFIRDIPSLLLIFAFFGLTIMLFKWFFLSLFFWVNFNIIIPLIQLVLSVTLYLIFHKFFNFLWHKLNPEDA